MLLTVIQLQPFKPLRLLQIDGVFHFRRRDVLTTLWGMIRWLVNWLFTAALVKSI